MLNYRDRLALIADYFRFYEYYLGEVTLDKLEAWVKKELGGSDGGWRNYNSVLHIISGNTNHAGLQSVLRALLVGGRHQIKLPSEGAEEVVSCLNNLPFELKKEISWSRVLDTQWLVQANVVIAYGSDETMKKIKAQLTDKQIFIGHGHKVGIAYVDMTVSKALEDLSEIAEALVRDVVAFNQQGCLSLQVVYVEGSIELRSMLSQKIAAIFHQCQYKFSYNNFNYQNLSNIAYARDAFALKTLLNDSQCQLWVSELSSSKLIWTVAIDDKMEIEQLIGNRWLWVKPWDTSILNEIDLLQEVKLKNTQLSSLSIYPYSKDYQNKLSNQSWDRLCKLGELQRPPLDWKPGNKASLLELVLQ